MEYPEWVCRDCGKRASGGKSVAVSSFRMWECGVCGDSTDVTQPRDYFYPSIKRFEEIKKEKKDGK